MGFNRAMRIFTAVLCTETNSFAPLPTGLRDFAVIAGAPDEPPHPYGLIIRAARERAADGHEIIVGRGGFATPGGLTTRAAYETLRDALLDDLRAVLPVDVVALGLHGAMIADGYEDAEGDLLAHVRALVGERTIIGAELDLHGHLTELKTKNADVIVFFKEYPHTDIYERAVETIDLSLRAARGEIKPVISAHDCGFVSLIHTTREPMRGFVDRMSALEDLDGVLSVSFIHSFPWGDCPGLGAKVLVVTDNDKALGDRLAAELAAEMFALRTHTFAPYVSPCEAIDQAMATNGRPIVLADAADNPGGGAAGDSTFLLRELIERGATSVAFGPLWDPGAVALCFSAGEGARLPLRIGGKTSPASGDPIDVEARVLACKRDVKMLNTFGRGEDWPLGDAVAIDVDGIEIVLTRAREQALGDVFTDIGIDWRSKKIVVVKSAQHFYAAYAPSAERVLYVETPGSMTMNWAQLPYRAGPPHLWPFDE